MRIVTVALLCGFFLDVVLCRDGDPLTDIFQAGDGSPELHVRRMRDVFHGRVRCGVQQGIAEKLCQQCLSAERILNMTLPGTTDTDNSTAGDVYVRASVVLLNYLLSFRVSCTAESVRQGYVGSCRTYEGCQSGIGARLVPLLKNESASESLDALEKILREVKPVFEPDPSKSCFSAEMVLNELNAGSKPLDSLPRDVAAVLLLTSHLYSGECIDVGESVADFLDDLFLHYGDGCERVMTQSGFSKLWNDLQLRRKGKHVDHGVQKKSCYFSGSDDASHPGTDERRLPDSENSTTLVVLIPHRHSENPQNSDVYLVGGEKQEGQESMEENAVPRLTDVPSGTGTRRVRHTPFPPEDHEHKNLANECLPSDDLLSRFLSPGNRVITSSEFLQLCPALVQQAVSGVCNVKQNSPAEQRHQRSGNETGEVQLQAPSQGANPWFAVASVSVITAISLLGLFLLPVLKKSFFVHVNAFFTGLAFGTMSGDVVLHLMPQYLALHSHSEGNHDDHGSSSESPWSLERLFPAHLQRQLAFLLTMYLLLLMECVFTAFTENGDNKQRHHHGHSHGPADLPMRDLTADVENGEAKPRPSRCSRIVEFLKPANLFSGMSSKAGVIVLADTVHNFADGMAIAVGFSTSYKDGFSTSVAVFFHELPHEIGDFAILMNCGLSYWKAFVFNLLSGLSAFIGLGVGVFTASLFREWLLCITAGLFFFVVMGEMLPDMRLESRSKWREFVVKIFGTVCGILTMICIAMYEISAGEGGAR